MTDDNVSRFYDEFASHYHLIFDNWEASMTRQAAAISSMAGCCSLLTALRFCRR